MSLSRANLVVPGLVCAFALCVAGDRLSPVGSVAASPEQADGPSWLRLPDLTPRYRDSALLDAPGQRIVVLGGEASLGVASAAAIQLDLASGMWQVYEPSGTVPTRRSAAGAVRGSGAVLDPAERVVVFVCDCARASTFLLDLNADRWQVAPNDRDLGVSGGITVYDPVGDQVLLFGGQRHGIGDYLAGAWAYDMSPARAGWRALPDVPFAVRGASATLDPAGGDVLVFGGLSAEGEVSATLWRFDLARLDQTDAWTDLTDLAGPWPPARAGAAMVFVPEAGAAVLYGGYTPTGDLDDVWLLDYGDPAHPTWRSLDPAVPGARSGHAGCWDAVDARMVVVGGLRGIDTSVHALGDAWALYLSGGPEPTPTATAPVARVDVFLPVADRSYVAP